MAEDFNKLKRKFTSFFRWKGYFQRREKKLEKTSVKFRLNSLKKNTINVLKHSKIMLRRAINVSLNLWKTRINTEFGSDSHMLAEIIKAWREVCERKGNNKKVRFNLE